MAFSGITEKCSKIHPVSSQVGLSQNYFYYLFQNMEEYGFNFIKKEEHKYIWHNSIPPYTKRFLFLITDFKIFYPKMATKSAATVIFGRVQRVLGF